MVDGMTSRIQGRGIQYPVASRYRDKASGTDVVRACLIGLKDGEEGVEPLPNLGPSEPRKERKKGDTGM